MSTEPNIFLRNATGLVRSWSVMDAFIYAFFSINLVTLGMYIMSQAWYFEGGMIPALIIGGLLVLPEVAVYSALIATTSPVSNASNATGSTHRQSPARKVPHMLSPR